MGERLSVALQRALGYSTVRSGEGFALLRFGRCIAMVRDAEAAEAIIRNGENMLPAIPAKESETCATK